MENTIKEICAAALLSILLTFNTATAGQGERPAVIAEGEIASSGVSGSFTYRPGVTGTFYPVQDEPLMLLRYRFWTLVGEPVWAFTARAPRLARIHLQTENHVPLMTIERRSNLPAQTVRWNEGASQVLVSDDLMDLARIYDFAFLAALDRKSVGRLPAGVDSDGSVAARGVERPVIYRSYQGILGQPGEWGWAVPGSPNWAETFSLRGIYQPSFTRESYREHFLGADTAKKVMRRLLHSYHTNGRPPLSHLEVGDFQLNIHDLVRAIRQAEPEALHLVHGVHSTYDEQLSDIIEDFADEVRRRGLTPELEREAESIDDVVSRHRQHLSATLLAAWEQMRTQAPSAAADHRAEGKLSELGPAVTRRLGEGHRDVPPDIKEGFEQARAFFATEPNLSDGIKERWRTLESSLEFERPQNLIGGRIQVNGDCTFTDVTTNLQWTSFFTGQECQNGKIVGDPKRIKNIGKNSRLDHAGHSDWRRPDFSEVISLIFCPDSDKTAIAIETTKVINNRLTEASVTGCPYFERERAYNFSGKFIYPNNEIISSMSRVGNNAVIEHFDSVKYMGRIHSHIVKTNMEKIKCWKVNVNTFTISAYYNDWSCDEEERAIWIWVRDES